MNYEFLKDVLGSPWQIEPGTLNSFYPVLRGLFTGLQLEKSAEPQNHLPYQISAVTRTISMWSQPEVPLTDEDPAPAVEREKVVHVLPIRSLLTKHDQNCGPVGTRTLGNRLLAADSDQSVIGHILIIESGGGQASAVPEMTDAIQKCTKPIVVWIDGMAASAAYYIACYCDQIIASRDMDWVGSIGTMAIYEGRKSKSAEDEHGVLSVTIYADGSEQKNEEWDKAINEFDFTLAKDRILNPFNEKFRADVLANRPEVQETQLTGKTFMAGEVIGSLVDSIDEFSTAVDQVLLLANFNTGTSKTAGNNQQIINPKKQMKQFSHLNHVLSVEALETTDEGVFLNEEQLQSVEDRLELNQQLSVERDQAVQQSADAIATLGTSQALLANAMDPFNAIDPTVLAAVTPAAKVEAIRILLASKPAVAAIQNLVSHDELKTDEVDWNTINNLAHNKQVDINS
jgi:protease IV